MSQYTPYDICAWARRQKTGQSSRKSILVLLAEYADRFTWECFPSVELLAENAELDLSTVGRALKRLEDDGFIARERLRRQDGSYCGWRFKLNPNEVETVIPGAAPSKVLKDEPLDKDGNYPSGNLPDGPPADPQDVGDGPVDEHNSHPASTPHGQKPIMDKTQTPTASLPGPIDEQPIRTTNSPLPPNVPTADAARLPLEGQAASASDDPPELARLKAALLSANGEGRFRSWFEDLKLGAKTTRPVPAGSDPETFPSVVVELTTPGAAKRDMIEQRFLPQIREAWRRANGHAVEIRLVARKPDPVYSIDQPETAKPKQRRRRTRAA